MMNDDPQQPRRTPAPAGWRSWAFFEDLRVAQEGLLSLGFWALQVYRFGHLRYRFQSRLVRMPLGVLHLILAKLMEMNSGITIGAACLILDEILRVRRGR